MEREKCTERATHTNQSTECDRVRLINEMTDYLSVDRAEQIKAFGKSLFLNASLYRFEKRKKLAHGKRKAARQSTQEEGNIFEST